MKSLRLFPLPILLCSFQQANAQVIPYFEGMLDCDTANTTVAFNLCSRYQADSATAALEELCSNIIHALDREAVALHSELSDTTDPARRLELDFEIHANAELKDQVTKSQASFTTYLIDMRELAGRSWGLGSGAPSFQSLMEYSLLMERIALLREMFDP
jgi:hypothetical protein